MIACLILGVILIVGAVALVRRVGWVAILLPAALIGGVYAMNRHAGCFEHAGDLREIKK